MGGLLLNGNAQAGGGTAKALGAKTGSVDGIQQFFFQRGVVRVRVGHIQRAQQRLFGQCGAVVEAAADADAAKGESDNGEAPKPVDNPDNSIDDGQTSDNSFLYDASIADLAGADSYYDKQTVQVTGEVVGEAIAVTGDADHAWIVLRDSDTGSTVTVFVRRSDLRKIDTYGTYGTTGTTLRVRGMFNLACSQHEGESDVHAQVVNVVSAGYEHKDVFNVEDFAPGVVALAVGIVLALVFWRMRERSR